MLEFDLPKADQSIIKVVGVGGGGSNAVNHMYTQGIVGVDFAVCNTDNQALASSPIPTKIQLGPGLTEGRGAGSKPEVGKHACLESIEDVQLFLAKHTKMLFITAGMGGGTGTGAAPIIAKTAKEMGILTVAIVTLPFTFEGKLRHRYAQEGLEELKRNVDSIIIISNYKLREIHGNLAFSEAFAQADNILTTAAKGIAEIITIAGYVNVDFEDVNTVMRDSGVAIMGSAQAEGEDRARRAVDMALNSPLLEDNNIMGAQNVLLNITSSSKRETTMDEISEITSFVQQEVGLDTNIIWGNCLDDELGDKLSVTVIASGFERHIRNLDQKPARKTVSLDDERSLNPNKFTVDEFMSSSNEVTQRNIQDTADKYIQTHTSEPYMEEDSEESFKKLRAREMMKVEMRKNASRVKLNNTHTIMELENTPAYVRRRVVLEEVPHSSERNYNHFTFNSDDEIVMRNDSPFLRDIAD